MIFDLFGTERNRLKKALKESLKSQVVLGMHELDEMADLLFPPLEIHKKEEQEQEVYVDYSVDVNLSVVLKDIQTGQVDEATIGSLKEAMTRIDKVKQMLSLNRGEWNRNIKYYVVGNNFDPSWMENIRIKADPL